MTLAATNPASASNKAAPPKAPEKPAPQTDFGSMLSQQLASNTPNPAPTAPSTPAALDRPATPPDHTSTSGTDAQDAASAEGSTASQTPRAGSNASGPAAKTASKDDGTAKADGTKSRADDQATNDDPTAADQILALALQAGTLNPGNPASLKAVATDAGAAAGAVTDSARGGTGHGRIAGNGLPDLTAGGVGATDGHDALAGQADFAAALADGGKHLAAGIDTGASDTLLAAGNAANGATAAPTALPGLAAAPAGMNATAANVLPDQLTPLVGSNGWDQALGQRVVWMVHGAEQSASLTLNPPDLGPLQVVLHVSKGEATASFTAAQPEVRHALESAMPKLRDMLGNAGISLGQTSINAGNPQQQSSGGSSSGAGSGGSRRNDAVGGVDGAGSADRPLATARRISRDGMVDTFA